MASRMFGLYGDFGASWLDAGNEVGTMRGTARVVTGTDADSNLETQVDLFDAFMTAVDAVTLGDLIHQEYVNTQVSNASQPTNGANRELKLLVQYQNVLTGKRFTMTIPTLDPTIPVYVININAKDVIQVDEPSAIVNLVTAFNNFVVDPSIPFDGTEYAVDPEIEVIGLKVVGRNI